MTANLHPLLVEAVTRRLVMARAARIGWDSAVRIQLNHDLADASLANAIMAYLDDNDPADAIQRYERDQRVLERHTPHPELVRMPFGPDELGCDHGRLGGPYLVPWPCDEIRDLLDVYPEVTP